MGGMFGDEKHYCVFGNSEVITLEGERWCLFFFFLNNDENLQLCNSSQFTKCYHTHWLIFTDL